MLHRSKVITIHFIFSIALIGAFFHALFADLHDYRMMQKTKIAIQEVQKVAEMSLLKVHLEQITCLATNIYWEASNEDKDGKIAVARVVLNRVSHGFASTPCKVIYQSHVVNDKKICQFSWVCTSASVPDRKSSSYKQAEDIAKKILLENKWSDLIPENVLFFHAVSINPLWKYKKFATIGNHVFYEKQNNK